MTGVNKTLRRLPFLSGKRCSRCQRSEAETDLNIEAVIHHNARKLECVDREACGKASKASASKGAKP